VSYPEQFVPESGIEPGTFGYTLRIYLIALHVRVLYSFSKIRIIVIGLNSSADFKELWVS
jgi:hypothetical protein